MGLGIMVLLKELERTDDSDDSKLKLPTFLQEKPINNRSLRELKNIQLIWILFVLK
jgi:hypothetical protein